MAQSLLRSLRCLRIAPKPAAGVRHLHRNAELQTPSQTPFVPDVATFLKLIGRKMSQFGDKISDWEDLFNVNGAQLRERGVEPPRSRKYIIHMREKFRRGDFGLGGDLVHVQDGAARIKVFQVPAKRRRLATMTTAAKVATTALNVPVGDDGSAPDLSMAEAAEQKRLGHATRVAGVRVRLDRALHGRHVEMVKGTRGTEGVLRVKEGLWEHKRGVKIDGGERRRAEVRTKRRQAAAKLARG